VEDKYVVWDGITEEPYIENPTLHDCMITVDMELISVQKRRREMLRTNIVPTVVFACKGGQSAFEKKINDKGRGVFSYYWNDLLRRDPNVTFREAIRQVNVSMQNEGLEQRAEVVCRIDVLDMPVDDQALLPDKKAHLIMLLDICRTNAEKGNRNIY
jgi:hypothetical protein